MRRLVLVTAAALLAALAASRPSAAQEKQAAAVRPFLARFPFEAKETHVVVRSDIGKEFSASHAKHAERTWTYFARFFAKSPGASAELHYTRDKKLYGAIAEIAGTLQIPDARQVASVWDKDRRLWFIVPYREPDFGTQLHEMSHDFLYATCPATEDRPWFKEGTGMYWETGTWTDAGDLVVERAVASYVRIFKEAHAKNGLVPLKTLVALPREKFYEPPVATRYAQAMALVHYLMKKQPEAMTAVWKLVNRGGVTEAGKLFDAVLANTKLDVAELEKRYVEYGLTLAE